jgi:hypothetical protein
VLSSEPAYVSLSLNTTPCRLLVDKPPAVAVPAFAPAPGMVLGELWGDMDPKARLGCGMELGFVVSNTSCVASAGSGVTARMVVCGLMCGRKPPRRLLAEDFSLVFRDGISTAMVAVEVRGGLSWRRGGGGRGG